MSKLKVLEKLKNQSIKDEGWLKEAKWRQENEAWLDLSFAIAVKILRTLRNRNMTQKDLAVALGLSPQYVNKIVKGSENLTIETITKIEKALQISLIEVPDKSSAPRFNFQLTQTKNRLVLKSPSNLSKQGFHSL